MDIKEHKEYLQQGLDRYKRRLETLNVSKADTTAERVQKELRKRLYCTICNICENSLRFIDGLIPDCEDLDEAAKKYIVSKGLAQNTDGGYRYNSTFLDLFKAGAIWQRNHIWHEADERPKKSGVKTAWITNDGVFYSGWYNKNAFGHEDMRDSITKFEFDKIRKWCYLEDLLNTD